MFAAGADFDHLEPAVADAFVVAPATANILAKMAHGLADDLLSCQLLAYPGPILAAPAMNPRMWSAPATRHNWEVLGQRGVVRIEPECGNVACGDTGQGRLAPIEEIFIRTWPPSLPRTCVARKVMLTLGPTREYFDRVLLVQPVHRDHGRLFWPSPRPARGEVTAVTGPVDLPLPAMIHRIPVTSAREMFEAGQATCPVPGHRLLHRGRGGLPATGLASWASSRKAARPWPWPSNPTLTSWPP
jgi:phosphopantothenoylcysteine decarboxylase/phosphopantothenate--cysteine ligase